MPFDSLIVNKQNLSKIRLVIFLLELTFLFQATNRQTENSIINSFVFFNWKRDREKHRGLRNEKLVHSEMTEKV